MILHPRFASVRPLALSPVVALALLCGCGERTHSEVPVPPVTAAQSQPTSAPIAAEAELEAAVFARRRALYEPLGHLAPPPGMAPTVLALVPPKEAAKLVHAEILCGLDATIPKPGEQRQRLRWVTLARGDALKAQVLQSLRAAGYVEAGVDFPRLPREIARGASERLELGVEEPPGRPSAVTVTRVVPDTAAVVFPMALAETLPGGLPPALTALAGEVRAYEYARRHARKPGIKTSESVRLSLLIGEAAEAEAADKVLREALLAEGFTKLEAGRDVFGRDTATIALRRAEGRLLVHFQNRWAAQP